MNVKRGADLIGEWDDFIRNGSEKAYHSLYTHYYHYLSFVGFKKGADVVNVKNYINDLFLYLWENRSHLSSVKDHHNYIITSFLRKLLRKENFREMYSLGDFELPEYLAIPSVESSHIARDTQEDIRKILTAYVEQLPEKQRGIIYQKYYLGLSYAEISKANHISVNTVYNTVYKALDKLKLLISKEHLDVLSVAITALSVFFLFFFMYQ